MHRNSLLLIAMHSLRTPNGMTVLIGSGTLNVPPKARSTAFQAQLSNLKHHSLLKLNAFQGRSRFFLRCMVGTTLTA